jgi:hypothetical protein
MKNLIYINNAASIAKSQCKKTENVREKIQQTKLLARAGSEKREKEKQREGERAWLRKSIIKTPAAKLHHLHTVIQKMQMNTRTDVGGKTKYDKKSQGLLSESLETIALVSFVTLQNASRVTPRTRRARCMSLGMMVTRLAWIAHRFVSSKSATK